MKFFVLTKQKIILTGCCVLAAVLAASICCSSYQSVVQTAATPRNIPIYCVETDKKQVSISFDAAWGNEQTDTLLDILKEKNVKATFFLVGNWVDKYGDSVKRIAQEGHDIGNHSSTHAHLPQLSDDKIKEDITQCNSKIEKLIGCKPVLFRPPYGDYNNNLVNVTDSIKMYCVQWNIDSLDWKDPTPDEMISRIKGKLQNGSIVLMHNGAKNTPAALPQIIDMIKSEGYEIVPISKLLLQGDYYTDQEGKMHSKTKDTLR